MSLLLSMGYQPQSSCSHRVKVKRARVGASRRFALCASRLTLSLRQCAASRHPPFFQEPDMKNAHPHHPPRQRSLSGTLAVAAIAVAAAAVLVACQPIVPDAQATSPRPAPMQPG
jgi:hypothetical protein